MDQLLKHNDNELKVGLFPRYDSPTFGERLSFLAIPGTEIGPASFEIAAPRKSPHLVAALCRDAATGIGLNASVETGAPLASHFIGE
jgi:hypothetical protein